jgi:hypothetical protein
MEHLGQMERLLRYFVDRLRKQSRILEPDQDTDLFPGWSRFERALADLSVMTVREQFTAGVRNLLVEAEDRTRGYWRDRVCRVILAALNHASLVGEEFTREILAHAWVVWGQLPPAGVLGETAERATLLRRALRAAAHFNLRPEFGRLLTLFEEWVRGRASYASFDPGVALEEAIRGLFHLGMLEEADQFLNGISRLLLQDRPIGQWDFTQVRNSRGRLRALLELARGWYAFGWDSLADPVLEKARTLLFSGILVPRDCVPLASASARAVGAAARTVADRHLSSLLDRLTGVHDTYTTASHFSVSQLDVAEAVVLSAVEVCART